MKQLDNIKMWNMFYTYISKINKGVLPAVLVNALANQGFEYKDGHIIEIEPEPKYYKCIREYRGFTVGKVYKTNEYGDLPSEPECPYVLGIENPYFEQFFRPATPEEISTIVDRPATEEEIKGNNGGISPNSPAPQRDNYDEMKQAEPNQENIPTFKELERSGKDELTEFEETFIALVDSWCGGDNRAYNNCNEQALRDAQRLITIARKQITREINPLEMLHLVEDSKTLSYMSGYLQGINDTLKVIKGE